MVSKLRQTGAMLAFLALAVTAASAQQATLTGRFYAESEENTNPNIPSTAEQLQHGGDVVSGAGIDGFRNPNDPNPCPAP